VGEWQAQIRLNERSSYGGTLSVSGNADALAGELRLTTPITVTATLTGAAVGDSARLSGPYTAGNGCTGTLTLSLGRAAEVWEGPAGMDDKCAGKLQARAALRR